MATQETLSVEAAATAFAAAARLALTDDAQSAISDETLTAALTAAVKLYAARAELRRDLAPPLSDEVTPTEVVVVASEMIRVVDLSPFDLSMWYRRAR